LGQKVIHLYPEQTESSKLGSIRMTEAVHSILSERQEMGNQPFPWSDSRIEKAWQWMRRKLNITDPQFVIHAFRHTCASRLVNCGVDLCTVKSILGHSSISVTEKYAHLNHSKLRSAMKVLERISEGEDA
jgi:site-specific recombinase XerD